MRLRVASPRDLVAGGVLAAIGTAGLWLSLGYRAGTLTQMGPGYVPRIVFMLLVAHGVAIGARALVSDGPALERWRLRPLVLVVAGMVVFGIGLETMGFVASGAALLAIVAFAAPRARPRLYAVVAILLLVATGLVFIHGLGIPMKLWPEVE